MVVADPTTCLPALFQTSAALPSFAPLQIRKPGPGDPVSTALIIQGPGVGPKTFASGIAVARDYEGTDILDNLAGGVPGAIRTQLFFNFSVVLDVKVKATIFEKDDTFPQGFDTRDPVFTGEIVLNSYSLATGSFPDGVENQKATDVSVPIEMPPGTMATIKPRETYIVGVVVEVPDFKKPPDTAWGFPSVKGVELADPPKPITVRNFAPGTSVMYFDAFPSSCLTGCSVDAAVASKPVVPGVAGESFLETTISIELVAKNPTAACATASPTVSPTAAPTASPTAAPTASPTTAPTAAPTASPTAAPTPPTEAPTNTPTGSPTKKMKNFDLPSCVCQNFVNSATTMDVGKVACAKSQAFDFGLATVCQLPERANIPMVDNGCPEDMLRCVVAYTPPPVQPCHCDVFENGAVATATGGLCVKYDSHTGARKCFPRNYDEVKDIGGSELFGCRSDQVLCSTD